MNISIDFLNGFILGWFIGWFGCLFYLVKIQKLHK